MVYVSASSDESCNLPMVEANAMGIPAVVFDCRGEYSDHCEYIKYGIVVNYKHKNNADAFGEAMFVMEHYHLCTRFLGINGIVPLNPKWKFYDFPLSYAEWVNWCKENKGEVRELTLEQWHKGASKYIFN